MYIIRARQPVSAVVPLTGANVVRHEYFFWIETALLLISR